jgi:hypothetical protein
MKKRNETMILIAASGQVGYGFEEEAFQRALEMGPDYIGCDAGSMDPGPFYLGMGQAFVSKEAYKRDLRIMVKSGKRLRIPVVIGSAGGGGGEPHLRWSTEILREIAEEEDLGFKLALIHTEPEKEYLKKKLTAGKIKPLGAAPEITDRDIDKSVRIVAMMGAEPIIEALKGGAEVVMAGRASDSAIFAAPALLQGYPKGAAWHLGKIIECGASVALPKIGNDCMIGHLFKDEDYFVVETPNLNKTCPRIRVAAHTLYENPNPYYLYEPSGMLDTSDCIYEQKDARSVKVMGSKFVPSPNYTVKLEGVEFVGYRTITIGGTRDPVLISQIDTYLKELKKNLKRRAETIGVPEEEYDVVFRIYGKNGVMGEKEIVTELVSHELAIIIDVVADTQEKAHSILSLARHLLLHTDFEGRLCISGNVAFPYSPSDIDTGPVYRFNIWHLLEPDDPLEPFFTEFLDIFTKEKV